MVDPNFWGSEDVSRLTITGRLMLVGMFSNADDEGRGHASPAYLRSTIFPYDDIPLNDIRSCLSDIAQWIGVTLYEINGQSYYQFDRWTKWQRVDKPSASLLPAPPIRSDSDSENDSRNDSEVDSCLKEEKEREEKKKRAREDSGVGGDIPDEEIPVTPDQPVPPSIKDFRDVMEATQDCGWKMPCYADERQASELIERHGAKWVIEAIKRAHLRSKTSWGVVRGILEDWQAKGGIDDPRGSPQARAGPVDAATERAHKLYRPEDDTS